MKKSDSFMESFSVGKPLRKHIKLKAKDVRVSFSMEIFERKFDDHLSGLLQVKSA